MSQERLLLPESPAAPRKSNEGSSNVGSRNGGSSNGGSGNVSSTTRRVGLIATGVLCGSLVALYAAAAPFVAPALRRVCLPFVPATPAQVDAVLGALRTRSGPLVDIGSGDGRIVRVVITTTRRKTDLHKIRSDQIREDRTLLILLKEMCVPGCIAIE